MAKFATAVADTSDKFAIGVVDTGSKCATGVANRWCTLTCDRKFSKKFEMI
jgi:hypothetical protein